jgi:hypothetical protein
VELLEAGIRSGVVGVLHLRVSHAVMYEVVFRESVFASWWELLKCVRVKSFMKLMWDAVGTATSPACSESRINDELLGWK